MNIGQAVRQALDPFGVDVDIEVETPAGKQKVDKAKEAKENTSPEAKDSPKAKEEQTKAKDTTEAVKEAPKPVEKAEEAKVEAKNNAENQKVDMVNDVAKSLEKMEVQKEPEAIETPKKPEEPPKDAGIEDWTVLDNTSTASPSPNKSKSASPEPETRGAEATIYPKLDNVPDLSGLDRKVKIALEAMENMGFTNEGGWLSNLLVKYDGDIGKVLDLLAPARA